VVADDLRSIRGEVRVDFVNASAAPLFELGLWLYPNAFEETPPGVQPGNRSFYQPFGPGFGGSSIRALTIDGSPILAEQVFVADAPLTTAWRIVLPRPLAPGQSLPIAIAFETRVPHRLGPFSYADGVLTALGGWHPYLVAGSMDEGSALDRRPPPADWEIALRLPQRHLALVGGRRLEADGEGRVELRNREWADLVVRPSFLEPIPFHHGSLWPLERAPGALDRDRAIPDPPPLPTTWVGDALIELIESLDKWADWHPDIPASDPVEVVVIPLRSEMAIATPGILAISDKAYKVTSIPILLRFHGKAIARAYFMRRLLPLVRAREAPGMVPQVADALASMYADRFAEQILDQSKGAAGILGAFDLIPSVDDFLRSADSAFAHVYFQPIADPIPVRDEPWTFNNAAPRGKLLREKLEDLLGPFQLPEVFRRYLRAEGCPPPPRLVLEPGPCTLQRFAEDSFQEDLGAFFRSWTERFPREDLRTRIVRTERLEDGSHETTVEVWRVGDTPMEVIEVTSRDSEDNPVPLVWLARDGESAHEFVINAKNPITSLRVDPRNRVFQTPAEPRELAAVGDRVPDHLQPVLASLSFAFSAADVALFGDVDVAFRTRDGVRRRWEVGLSYQPARLQARTSLSTGFGDLVGAARYTHSVGLGLTTDFLRPAFADSEAPAGYAVGPTFFYLFDDRPPGLGPREGRVVSARLSPAVAATQGGESGFFTQVGLTGLQLFPLGYSQALAVRVKGIAQLGQSPFQSRLALGGSDAVLRGFGYEEVLGKRQLILSAEWRHTFVTNLDIDLGIGRIQEIGGALFADGAAMGGIVRPHALEPGPSSGLFADVGYGLRLQYALFGVRPLNLIFELSTPFGRTPSDPALAPVTFSVRGGYAFADP